MDINRRGFFQILGRTGITAAGVVIGVAAVSPMKPRPVIKMAVVRPSTDHPEYRRFPEHREDRWA